MQRSQSPPRSSTAAPSRTRYSRARSRLLPVVFLTPVPIALVGTACDSREPAGPNPSAGATPSAAVAAASTTDSAISHEPAGFTPLAEWSFSELIPAGGAHIGRGSGITKGVWWRYNWGATESMRAVTDTGAPKSPPGGAEWIWPAGLRPGTSPGVLLVWADDHQSGYSKLYESGWIKIPSADFEVHGPSGGLKLLGLWASGARGLSDNNLVGWAAGRGSNPVKAFTLELRQQNFVTKDLVPNVDTSPRLTCGAWHHYELLMEVNDIGTANGKFKMWLDGTLTHDYDNVVYRTRAYQATFFARKWDPTWGGEGGGRKQRTDRLRIDHLYLSGVR